MNDPNSHPPPATSQSPRASSQRSSTSCPPNPASPPRPLASSRPPSSSRPRSVTPPHSLATSHSPRRTIIAHHLILTLYGHWPPNDPRGSGPTDFYDPKFAPLGPIYHGRKPDHLQPSKPQLRSYLQQAQSLMNFPILWIDDTKQQACAHAIRNIIRQRQYTAYACAICSNHPHLLIRKHRDDALTMLHHFAQAIRSELQTKYPQQITPDHPVISQRPYKVFLYTPDEVWGRIRYIEQNPVKEKLPAQPWDFVTPYNNWPYHKTPNLSPPSPKSP